LETSKINIPPIAISGSTYKHFDMPSIWSGIDRRIEIQSAHYRIKTNAVLMREKYFRNGG